MDNPLDILAYASDAVCAVNDEKCVVYWNTAAEVMLGFSADEAAGQPCWKLFKGKTPDGQPFCDHECPIQAKIEAQEPISHFDLWVKNKSGQSILTNFSTIIIPQRNGSRQLGEAAVVHLMRASKNRHSVQYRLRINILGPLQVWRADGMQVDGKFWRRAKVRGLFVFLALKRGEPATREELIAALWPELEYAAALRNLNTTVYNLRRSLEPGLKQGHESHYIFYEAGHYWLGGSQPHWIDIDAFKLSIQQARQETAVNKAIDRYEEALALYRGDYLVDLIATSGIGSSAEQIQLRQLYLNALEELGDLHQQQEHPEQARNTYLKILAIDPYRESTCQQLVRLSHGADPLIDSIAYCQRLAAALRDELDLLLSLETFDRYSLNKLDDISKQR